MANLEPTPELIETARRVATGTWTVAEDEPGYPTDPHLAQLLDVGLVVLWYPPTRHRADYWTLTTTGIQWLANATADPILIVEAHITGARHRRERAAAAVEDLRAAGLLAGGPSPSRVTIREQAEAVLQCRMDWPTAEKIAAELNQAGLLKAERG